MQKINQSKDAMESSQYNSRISKSTFDYLNTFYEGCKDESLIKNKQ